jgi:hypothetical protein
MGSSNVNQHTTPLTADELTDLNLIVMEDYTQKRVALSICPEDISNDTIVCILVNIFFFFLVCYFGSCRRRATLTKKISQFTK